MAKIVSWKTKNRILFEHDGDLRETVIAAIDKGVNLSWGDVGTVNLYGAVLQRANLRRVYLSGSNFQCANLSYSDFRESDLQGANLQFSNLHNTKLWRANLQGVDFKSSNLYNADLSYANLRKSNFKWANLYNANFTGAILNWNSQNLIAEILRQAAGKDIEKSKYAGLVLLRRDLCWGHHLELADPQLPWALTELAKWVQPGDNHPECLDEYVVAAASE